MTEKMKSFVKGIMAGLVTKARMPQGKELIGYFYGHVAKEDETPTDIIDDVGYVGAVLHDVYSVNGDWYDTELYRIVYRQGDEFRLVLFPYAFSYITEAGASYIATIGGNLTTAWLAYKAGNYYWNRASTGNNTTLKLLIPTENIVWTSHDLLYENSTDIFLATSDCICIPIYE